jgi:hypothetical protein
MELSLTFSFSKAPSQRLAFLVPVSLEFEDLFLATSLVTPGLGIFVQYCYKKATHINGSTYFLSS